MQWSGTTTVSGDRKDAVFLNRNAMKFTDSLPLQIFLFIRSFAAAHYPGPEGNNPVDDCAGPFLDNIVIPVEKSDDSIWGFLDADYVVRIKIHQLFVHTCQHDHAIPGKTIMIFL